MSSIVLQELSDLNDKLMSTLLIDSFQKESILASEETLKTKIDAKERLIRRLRERRESKKSVSPVDGGPLASSPSNLLPPPPPPLSPPTPSLSKEQVEESMATIISSAGTTCDEVIGRLTPILSATAKENNLPLFAHLSRAHAKKDTVLDDAKTIKLLARAFKVLESKKELSPNEQKALKSLSNTLREYRKKQRLKDRANAVIHESVVHRACT